MGIIYTPNILNHWFTDSLYDTPNFQKLWYVIDFIFFRNFYTSMAKWTPAMTPMMGEESCHQVCLYTDMKLCYKLYYPKKQLSVGKLLVFFKCQLHFKQYIKTKRVCFGIKFYRFTSSNGTTLNFSVKCRKRMFHNGDENSDTSAPERTPFYQIFFSLTGNTRYTTSFS